MLKSRVTSPSRSQGASMTPRRRKSRGTRSVGSPAHSNASGRLTSVIEQFKENNMDSVVLSPLSKTILTDNTDIEQPRRKSWWKNVENSRDVIDVLNDENIADANNVLEEFDVELISQEKTHHADIPESSGSESIGSIVIPRRKLFTQKDNLPQNKFDQVAVTRKSLSKHNKTNIDHDKTANVGPRNLFNRGPKRPKPIFPAALLNMSPDKSVANKTKEIPTEITGQPRNLFGNQLGNKRKNMFADFVVSESDDEISEIQPKLFAFQRNTNPVRHSIKGTRDVSPNSSVTTDIEMDDWKFLPSSTMVDHQFEIRTSTTSGKKARLSKLSEAKESEAGTNSTGQNKTVNKDVFKTTSLNNEDISSTKTKVVKDQTNKKSHSTAVEENNKQNIDEENVEQNADEDFILKYDENEQADNVENNFSSEQNFRDLDAQGKLNENEFINELTMQHEIKHKSETTLCCKLQQGNQTAKETEKDINSQKSETQTNLNMEPLQELSFQKVGNGYEVIEAKDQENRMDIVETALKIKDDEKSQMEIDENNEKEVTLNDEVDLGNKSQKMAEHEKGNNILIPEEDELEHENQEEEENNEENENDEGIENEEEDDDENYIKSKSHAEVELRNVTQEEIENNKEDGIENESREVEKEDENEIENDEIENENQEDVDNEEDENESGEQIENEEDNDLNENEEEIESDGEDEIENESSEEIENEEENELRNETQEEIEEEDEIEQESQEEVENEEEDELRNETQEEIEEEDEIEQESPEEVENEEEDKSLEKTEDEEEEEIEQSQDQIQDSEEIQDDDEVIAEQHQDEVEEQVENQQRTSINEELTSNIIKSPEVILNATSNQIDSFIAKGRNTNSIRKTKSILRNFTLRPSIAPPRESTGFSDGTRNSSAEGSGWDSHRTTRKTLRQTFGKDFTPRKSLRTLVMEKSAKRQTAINEANALKLHPANSTEIPDDAPHDYNMENEENVESDHEISKIKRQATLDMYLQKIRNENKEIETHVRQFKESLNSNTNRVDILNRVANSHKIYKPAIRRTAKSVHNALNMKRIKPSVIPLDHLPAEFVEDMKYKPPKRFRPSNAPWITKRLYKFLESKLEPKYDYKARVRAEKLVQTIYEFAKQARRRRVAEPHAISELEREMARLDIIKTHFDFYSFFHEFMPMEIKVKVVPDSLNDIPMPRNGLLSDILY